MPELIVSDLLPTGTPVMLTADAPLSYQLLLGSESVMSIVYQSGGDDEVNSDGDIIVRRKYCVEHQHRGRLFFGVPESILQVVEARAAAGQVMIHAEMTRQLVDDLGLRAPEVVARLTEIRDGKP